MPSASFIFYLILLYNFGCFTLLIKPPSFLPSLDKSLVLNSYSHSIVAGALGLKSYKTRHTPSTSLKILSVIFFKTDHSSSGTVALIASTVFTARMITGQSNTRFPSRTPVERKSGTTVKNCQTLFVNPALSNYSRKIASESRSARSLSRVIAPVQRTPSPGPGKG